MASYTANQGYGQYLPPPQQDMDARTAGFNTNRDSELLDLSGVVSNEVRKRKPFDWCILSVLGCLLCPCVGLCATYYARRANHGYDHNIEDYKIRDSSAKAKVLTILSLILAVIVVVVIIVYIVAVVNFANNIAKQNYDTNYGK